MEKIIANDGTFITYYAKKILRMTNLSIVDMLYSGHFAIADKFSWNRPNYGQFLLEKPLYSGQLL